MSYGEQQAEEIKTIRERNITVKLSDADCNRLARKCGEHGLTVGELIENFIGDLVDGTHSNGSDKKLAIQGGIRSNDYLLDDYTKNLDAWEPPAKGIKLLNGINHTKGTWLKNRIRMNRKPQELANIIVSVMKGKSKIYDDSRDLTMKRSTIGKTR